jgi:7-keto-8-aminopelargonate synthetase-like enzyme
MDRIDDFLSQRKADDFLNVLISADLRKESEIYYDGAELFGFSSNGCLALSNHTKLRGAPERAVGFP